MILDKRGRPSCNPDDLYNQDGTRAGAILPFGGEQGYKGYGLSLMIQIMGRLLGTPIPGDRSSST
jgi:LDH2 family malate/lactate/ureidoglycolate dehydrogenase